MIKNNIEKKYTCPSCGYKTLTGTPGTYDICPVCYWEDDAYGLYNMYVADGANYVSLEDAQKNFIKFGASEERFKDFVIKENLLEKDLEWRPLDRNIDNQEKEFPNDINNLYYWLLNK